MKLLYLLLLLFAATYRTAGQDTIFYDALHRATSHENAKSFRTVVKSATGWDFADHEVTGRTIRTGSYADESMRIRSGEFVSYDSAGMAVQRCQFSDNKKNGPDTFYHSSGQILMIGSNKDNNPDGEWTGYYKSGQLAGKASYKDGKQMSCIIYNEDGSPDNTRTRFWQDADFPGGDQAWVKYLNSHLHYPQSAAMANKGGTVTIQFKVTSEGKVADCKVLRPVDPALDAQALRIVQWSGDWLPAVMGGVPLASFKVQAIVFRM